MMGQVLEEIDGKHNFEIVKVNIDKFNQFADEYKVLSIPTLLFFKDGEKVNEVVGYRTEEELLKLADEAFK